MCPLFSVLLHVIIVARPALIANLVKSYSSRMNRIRHISLEQSLFDMTQKISTLDMQHFSVTAEGNLRTAMEVQANPVAPYLQKLHPAQDEDMLSSRKERVQPWIKYTIRNEWSMMECLLGTIRTNSIARLLVPKNADALMACCEQDQYVHETTYAVYPAPWLTRLGLRRGFHFRLSSSSTQGWQHTLQPFCAVPDDSLIFKFCEKGNIAAVRTLLSEGSASIRDTNSEGFTPLHVSRSD